MIRVVAFDLDDTLWPVKPVLKRAEGKLGDWLSARVPELAFTVKSMRALAPEVMASNPGIGERLTEFRTRLIELALLKSGLPQAKAAALAEQAMEVFLVARSEVEYFPGVLEVIESIASRYQLGALTNGNVNIQQLELSKYFSFGFSAERDVAEKKPHPALFQRALLHTGVQPQEMVYVGDHPVNDVDSANQVGLFTVWARSAASGPRGETKPDKTIDHISELPAVLAELDQP